MNQQLVEDIVAGLERSKAAVLIAPAKSGKSTYIPLKMYNEVIKRNPEGVVYIVESTERAATTLSNFTSRIQKKKIIGYLDESTEPSKLDLKVIYMSISRFVQLLFEEKANASLVILSNAFMEDLFINLVQYLWYNLSFQGKRVPYLLFTSSVQGELSIIKDVPIFSMIPKDYLPPKIVYSTFDSTVDTLAKDMTEAIGNYRRNGNPEDKYLVFVPTGYIASQIETLLGQKSKITFITSDRETEVPHGEYSVVFDSGFTNYDKSVKRSIKLVCEIRCGYGKICKRLLTEETYNNFSASRTGTMSLERLLRVALLLSDSQIDYKSFFIISKVPEILRRKIDKTIYDLDLLNEEGTLNERGNFVSQLYLDGYLSLCIYELLKSRKNISVEITLFAAVSVCGMNLFGKDFNKITGGSDLEVLAQIIVEFLSTDLSLREFSKENILKEKYLREIKDRTNSILKVLYKLDFNVEDQKIATSGKELVEQIEPILKNVYKTVTLKHSHGRIYSGYSTFSWNPAFVKGFFPPSESLIPLATEEFYTSNGIRKIVTLGHPINDLDAGESTLKALDEIFDDL